MSRSTFVGGGIIAALALAASTHAAVITTSDFKADYGTVAYTASTTSLIQAGNEAFDFASSSTAITGGVTPSHDANLGTFSYLDGQGYSITYNLDLSVNTLGYDISSIRTISGWPNNNNAGRIQQSYTVTFTTVDDAEVTVVPTHDNAIVTGGGWLERVVSDDTSALLASGVKSVRFDIALLGVGTIYHEIEVEGTATPIPEPAALSLLGGTLLLLTRRRR